MVESSESAQPQMQRVQEFIAAFQSLRSEVRKVIVGHDEVITHVLIGLFAGGHVLLEGVPADGHDRLFHMLDVGFGSVDGDKDAGKHLAMGGLGKRLHGVGVGGTGAQVVDDFVDVGAHFGEVGLVFAVGGLGDTVEFTGLRRGKGLQEDLLGTGERCGSRGSNEVAAFGGGLLELLADESGVDAQLLRGVSGELVAGDAVGDAADVRHAVPGFALFGR